MLNFIKISSEKIFSHNSFGQLIAVTNCMQFLSDHNKKSYENMLFVKEI